jgi:hypothetical protein
VLQHILLCARPVLSPALCILALVTSAWCAAELLVALVEPSLLRYAPWLFSVSGLSFLAWFVYDDFLGITPPQYDECD